MKVRGKLPDPKPVAHHPDEIGPGWLRLDAARIERALAHYRNADFVAPDMMRLADRALALEAQYHSRFAPLAEGYPLAAEQAAARIEEGRPLLDADELPLDGMLLRLLVEDVIALADFTPAEIQQQLRDWLDRLAANADGLEQLLRLSVTREKEAVAAAAKAAGLADEVYWFVLHQVGCAMLPAYAEHLAPLVADDRWLRGTCPICGNAPVMGALVGEGGKRHLVCGVCRFVWSFGRMRCPHCDNQNLDRLRVLTVSDDSPYRLDVCDECRSYVKTIDYRLAPEHQAVLIPVEDAATLYLDLKAGEEGFRGK